MPDPPDLDLRRLRYFVALAEELHFGKAAERLFITQPMLSRQIRRLEQELGVDLLTRSSRHVQLTLAGRQLVEDAAPLLATADATGRRVRRAATGRAALTVGFLVGDPIIQLVRAFDAKYPDTDIDVERIYWADQPGALLDDHVDVSFVHLPMEDDGLELAHLYSSPTMVLLPESHRLAERSEIAIGEVADDPVVLHWGASPVWEAWNTVDPRPDGRRPRRGPTVRNIEEKIEVVGTGRAISFIPVSVIAAIQIPPEVTAIPVVDVPPTRCVSRGGPTGDPRRSATWWRPPGPRCPTARSTSSSQRASTARRCPGAGTAVRARRGRPSSRPRFRDARSR